MDSLQYFNIRLFTLSARVAVSLGLSVSGVVVDTSSEVQQNLLFLEITARNSAWRPTYTETGELAHVTVEGVGLVIAVVSTSADVNAAASFSSVFASTVSVQNAKAQYKVDITRLPHEVTDALLSGLTLAGPISLDALDKIGEALGKKWPELLRKDPDSLHFREIQLQPVKLPTMVERLTQVRNIGGVARNLAAGKTREQTRQYYQGLQEHYEKQHPGLAYDGPNEVLVDAVYAVFDASAGDPEQTGAADRARKWLHLHAA